MSKTLELFSKELSSLRTGRANASLLDLIKVDVYVKNANKSASYYNCSRTKNN